MKAYFDRRDGGQRHVMPLSGDRVTVGSGSDNDLIVDEESVSGRHAIVYQLNGGWFIEDCGSRAGTAVNGRKLTSLHPLRPGDQVRLGRAKLFFGQLASVDGALTDVVVEPRSTANGDPVAPAPSGSARLRWRADGVGKSSADGRAVLAAGVVDDGQPDEAPPDRNRSPYPGLAPFSRDNADLFFGREDAIGRCLNLLESERFVALVGASGSGKSSILQAGLVPHLHHVVMLQPGERPLRSLAEAGAADRPNSVLVVDQLEDVVTLCHDERERAAFLAAIVDHPGGVAVAVRADHCGDFAGYPEFALLLASGQVLLGPLSEDGLVRAVQEPARRCGAVIETDLTKLVAAELGDAPEALPLLGHALRETWERRNGDTITIAGYRETGGVRSAIAQSAERVFGELGNSERAVARKLLLRMVDLQAGGATRRWIAPDAIADHPARGRAVLSAFAAARLVAVDGERTTVAHDSVLGEWPRLAGWIAEERAALLTGRGVHEDRARTIRLRLLAGAMSLLALIALVFGAATVSQRNSAIRERDDARQATLVATAQASRAAQPDLAMFLAAEAHADAHTPASAGLLVDALAAQPTTRQFLPEAQAATVGDGLVATASGNEVRLWTEDGWRPAGTYTVGDAKISDLALSGDTLVAAVPDDRLLVAVDATTGRQLTDPVHYGRLQPTRVGVAGDRVLVLLGDGLDSVGALRVEQREIRTLKPSGPVIVAPAGRLRDVAASPDGARAALATGDGAVWLADLATGTVALGVPAPAPGVAARIDDLAWRDDLVVAGRVGGSVDAWRAEPGGQLTAVGHYEAGGDIGAVAAGCGGTCVAAGTVDGRVIAWGVSPDRVLLDAASAHTGRVTALVFTSNGESVISADADHITAVHALDGSLSIAPLVIAGGPATRGVYQAGGGILLGAGSADPGQIIRWSDTGHIVWRADVNGAVTWLASTDRRAVALVAPLGAPVHLMLLSAVTGRALFDQPIGADQVAAAITPDGSTVVLAAVNSSGTSIYTVDVDNPFMSSPIAVEDRVLSMAFSPDGAFVVTGHASGDVAVRRPGTFAVEARSEESAGSAVTAIAVSSDGGTVLAGEMAGVIQVFDAATLEARFPPLEGHRGAVTGVAANDQLIITTSDDGTVRLWDLASGAAVGGPISTGGTEFPSIALRDDGERALVPGDRGLLELVVDEDEWVSMACSIAGRELTADERVRYGLDGSASACGRGS